jgi:hypothetical protein
VISAAKNLKIRRLKLSNITHLKFWKMYRKRIVCITILMYNKNINIDFHFQGFIGCNCAYILKSECVWIKVLADYLNENTEDYETDTLRGSKICTCIPIKPRSFMQWKLNIFAMFTAN